jgi:hypothetical protein
MVSSSFFLKQKPQGGMHLRRRINQVTDHSVTTPSGGTLNITQTYVNVAFIVGASFQS